MRVVHERCCGMDVHKRTVVACVLGPDGQQTRTFGTMTRDLLALAEWLRSLDISHAAMESMGVFWQPIYNVLEDAGLNVLVVNARHIKAVPGRKTDVKDAEWIANLLHHGLLKASFMPSAPQRELRELTRYRVRLRARTGKGSESASENPGRYDPQTGRCGKCCQGKGIAHD